MPWLVVIVIAFLFWSWPSGGAAEKVKHANPHYQDPDGDLQYLVEKYHGKREYPEDFWFDLYLSLCESHGDWSRIRSCIAAHEWCQEQKPLVEGQGVAHYDLSSKQNESSYRKCLQDLEPKYWKRTMWRKVYTAFESD